MDKRIGIMLIIVALIIGAIAVVENINSKKIIIEFENQTGSCHIGETCLYEQNTTMFFAVMTIAIVVFIIGALILALPRFGLHHKPDISARRTVNEKTRTQNAKQMFPKPKSSLTPEQKKLYELLVKADGAMLQGDIVNKSGLNKVTVSRLLDKMEMQGMIERKRHGMSNIVQLKKK